MYPAQWANASYIEFHTIMGMLCAPNIVVNYHCTIGTILYPRVISHKSVEYIRWTH